MCKIFFFLYSSWQGAIGPIFFSSMYFRLRAKDSPFSNGLWAEERDRGNDVAKLNVSIFGRYSEWNRIKKG